MTEAKRSSPTSPKRIAWTADFPLRSLRAGGGFGGLERSRLTLNPNTS